MNLPSEYKPTSIEEFIGPAKAAAKLLVNLADRARANDNASLKILLNGEPGIGKSALAEFLARHLGCTEKHSRLKFNGTQIKIETVEDIARQLQYRSLYGDYNFIWIDEADKIPSVAQVRFLTLLDDLNHGCAVVCTSNCRVEDFEKRFQSRFRMLEIEPPQPHEIMGLLSQFLTHQPTITQIAQFACGNVRAALLDADLAVAA